MNKQHEEREEQVYTVAEAAQILKLSERTVLRMIAEGELEAKRVRYRWRIKASSLQKYL